MENLSVRQKEVLDFIKAFMKEKKYSPTTREIAEGIGKSSSVTYVHLCKLKDKRVIHWVPETPRTIRIRKVVPA